MPNDCYVQGSLSMPRTQISRGTQPLEFQANAPGRLSSSYPRKTDTQQLQNYLTGLWPVGQDELASPPLLMHPYRLPAD
ncbi:hypothetical protein BO83DRAFT_16539 [Aspergillus eucalypticola CBS 122712]|uniref:Uncharacterized protein n=1 Tax=Aspergillus eucalypticola (strain CBS 122712 / IBT 29274) TaxID=1448314 RepID=A0A317VPL7_ASPEC|nr:uncharacterized protein BO83DRAFT_16539 [Aspergillus eucalypticola CBS 122712]PWY74818.1 hypothetical protein BO83DRAFT_16539 [Aspergillus eucalypticola CBS 122712]